MKSTAVEKTPESAEEARPLLEVGLRVQRIDAKRLRAALIVSGRVGIAQTVRRWEFGHDGLSPVQLADATASVANEVALALMTTFGAAGIPVDQAEDEWRALHRRQDD